MTRWNLDPSVVDLTFIDHFCRLTAFENNVQQWLWTLVIQPGSWITIHAHNDTKYVITIARLRFYVLAATRMKLAVFRNISTSDFVDIDRRLRGEYASVIFLEEAVSTCETSVNIYQTVQCNIPEKSHLDEVLNCPWSASETQRSGTTSSSLYEVAGFSRNRFQWVSFVSCRSNKERVNRLHWLVAVFTRGIEGSWRILYAFLFFSLCLLLDALKT